MRQGLAAELEPHRHHGSGVVNMDSDGDDLKQENFDDNSYQMDKEEVEDLFKKLDRNNDGRIDLSELAEGLKHLHGSRYKAGQAQVCIQHITGSIFSSFPFISRFLLCLISNIYARICLTLTFKLYSVLFNRIKAWA